MIHVHVIDKQHSQFGRISIRLVTSVLTRTHEAAENSVAVAGEDQK